MSGKLFPINRKQWVFILIFSWLTDARISFSWNSFLSFAAFPALFSAFARICSFMEFSREFNICVIIFHADIHIHIRAYPGYFSGRSILPDAELIREIQWGLVISKPLDESYETNMEGALENGIKTGVYFFTQALNQEEAEEEAEFVAERSLDYRISSAYIPLL